MGRQLQVFSTVDTEVWPYRVVRRQTALAAEMNRDFYGVTDQGRFGVPFQLEILNSLGLKAVFFVEGLFASAVGTPRLREIIHEILRSGHEVQLHLHPEWLAWTESSCLPGRAGQNLHQFTEEEQSTLIATGLRNLSMCGAKGVCAFRAGNYGADEATLRALRRNGIRYDTSYNFCYLNAQCRMLFPKPLLQPKELYGVVEVPITFFRDGPCHHRHLQLMACSYSEIRNALISAYEEGWSTCVVVSHSFELLQNRKRRGRSLAPDRIVIARFRKLCHFLNENPHRFRTTGFADVDPQELLAVREPRMLRSNVLRTIGRMGEQGIRRLRGMVSR